ncbi:hypothetical protein VDGD_10083 [Verticillium dahliae]|nr:Zinc transporter ZIP9 [Verticillium dahliae VDG1]RBQ66723.1 hypothetical protein VDGD_10083 [Verticillium dahliae]
MPADDDFGADADFLAALAASDSSSSRPHAPPPPPKPQAARQQGAPRIQQPTPQRLDKAPPASASASGGKVVQPTPQALPKRSSGSAIQVSPRQRGNPVLASLRSLPWEYSDIPADFVLGLTTCALFLSLKYHRLHPEYIYQRIRNLQGKYNLRIILAMVDIPNHEDSLRELSKTSLVSNVTVILCWSAAEAARYLELYKSYEHANFSAIRGQQSSSYAEKLVDFVTVPRSVNKADAIALVSTFGSLKDAVNADAEQIGVIAGWGTIKVNKWIAAVDEPFRAKKAAKRKLVHDESTEDGTPSRLDQARPIGRVPLREMSSMGGASADTPPVEAVPSGEASAREKSGAQRPAAAADEDDEDAMIAAAIEESKITARAEASQRTESAASSRVPEELNDGIAAALARLRDGG